MSLENAAEGPVARHLVVGIISRRRQEERDQYIAQTQSAAITSVALIICTNDRLFLERSALGLFAFESRYVLVARA